MRRTPDECPAATRSNEKAKAMSMKILRRVALTSMLILGAVAVWFAWQLSPQGQLGYVAKQTQLDLPLFPSNLHVYDDAEMTVTAHLNPLQRGSDDPRSTMQKLQRFSSRPEKTSNG